METENAASGTQTLADRMRSYEELTRTYVERDASHVVIRLDGRSFHTYTRGLVKPFQPALHEGLVLAAEELVKDVAGARLAYVQSDEVSVLCTLGDNPRTQHWFNGNVQKMTSVSASVLGGWFNRYFRNGHKMASFDARVVPLPSATEAQRYFLWRQRDARRNSIASLAQTLYSPREITGVKTGELVTRMRRERGVNWDDCPAEFRLGSVVYPERYLVDVDYVDPRTQEVTLLRDVERSRWIFGSAPVFRYADDSFLGLSLDSTTALPFPAVP